MIRAYQRSDSKHSLSLSENLNLNYFIHTIIIYIIVVEQKLYIIYIIINGIYTITSLLLLCLQLQCIFK